jgi:lipopolysaccharide export system protein LptC
VPRSLLPASLLALLAACTPNPVPGGASEPPAVVMQGVQLRSYEGSTLAMTGQAEQATYHRTGDLSATQATLRVLDKHPGQGGSGDTTVRARLMEGNLGTQRMVASGDVEVRTSSGVVARTPRATYDGAEQSVRGTEGVQVKGPDYRLTADTYWVSLPDGRYTFEGSEQSVQTVLGATRD